MCIDSKLDLSYFKLVLGHVREVNGVELFRKFFLIWQICIGLCKQSDRRKNLKAVECLLQLDNSFQSLHSFYLAVDSFLILQCAPNIKSRIGCGGVQRNGFRTLNGGMYALQTVKHVRVFNLKRPIVHLTRRQLYK